jgi:hypothetical protein
MISKETAQSDEDKRLEAMIRLLAMDNRKIFAVAGDPILHILSPRFSIGIHRKGVYCTYHA